MTASARVITMQSNKLIKKEQAPELGLSRVDRSSETPFQRALDPPRKPLLGEGAAQLSINVSRGRIGRKRVHASRYQETAENIPTD